MKILIIVPRISQSGGTERAATNLANMLDNSGYPVTLLSLSSMKEEVPYYNLNSGIDLLHQGLAPIPIGILEKFKWFPKAIRVLKSRIAGIGPDIIVGEGHNINSMLPFISKGKTALLIGCEHIVYSTIPISSRIVVKILYRFLDSVVALSLSAKKGMEGLNSNIVVIPNTLPFLPETVSDLDSGRILMVGRLSGEKGYERLVPIAKILRAKYPSWHIDIFGEGDSKDDLLDLFKKEEVNDFITINLPVKNIQEEYLKSSIYLMTSYTEALPMVLLEAKSCGIPVIGYHCEGTSELINDHVDGYLVDDGDVSDMTEKLSLLIENPELRSEIGARARIKALEYEPEIIIRRWMDVIGEMGTN